MYKTESIEKAYSRAEIRGLKKAFSELRKVSHTQTAKEYVRKVKADLKS